MRLVQGTGQHRESEGSGAAMTKRGQAAIPAGRRLSRAWTSAVRDRTVGRGGRRGTAGTGKLGRGEQAAFSFSRIAWQEHAGSAASGGTGAVCVLLHSFAFSCIEQEHAACPRRQNTDANGHVRIFLLAPERAGDGPWANDFADHRFGLLGYLSVAERCWRTTRIGGVNKFLK
jgi:hypothetical protein